MKIKLMKQEYEESQMKQTIEDLCAELPQFNISSEAPLSQKVKIIVEKEKDFEETIEKMDAENKARIVELEARAPRMPPIECGARVAELQSCAATIETRLAETHKLLNETTETWITMEGIDGLKEVHEALQMN